MKIALASDFHLSYRQYGLLEREEDFYKQFNNLIDEIIKEKPDLFIELGDIFDEPQPKPKALKIFGDGIKKLKANGIKVIGILGNHTIVQRKDFYPIDFIFENIKYLDGDYLIFNDVFIGGVAYHNKTQKYIKDKIDFLAEESKAYDVKILLLHQGLKNDIEIGYEFTEEELELNRFDYVFLGHVHKRMLREKDNTVYHYVGSLNSCSVIELVDEIKEGKGYTIFETDTGAMDFKKISPIREFVDVEIIEDDLNDNKINEVFELLNDKSIKPMMRVKCEANNPAYIYDICKEWETKALHINKNITKKQYNNENEMNMEDFISIEEAIRKTVNEKYDEKWYGDFAVELYKKLITDKDSAIEYANEIYKEKFDNGKNL